MSAQLSPLGRLHFGHEGVIARLPEEYLRLEPYLASILELFAHHHDFEHAYDAYLRLTDSLGSAISELPDCFSCEEHADITLLIVGQRILICTSQVSDEAYRLANLANKWSYVRGAPTGSYIQELFVKSRIIDLSTFSRTAPIVAKNLAKRYSLDRELYPALTFDRFAQEVEWLCGTGLLTVPAFQVDFGDLRRHIPLCPNYGYTRGTPIDRFYLDQFVQGIRQEVVGVTLEIGGRQQNREQYGFQQATEYHTLDSDPRSGADIIGDAHDSGSCAENCFDSIILFNVLEHCAKPWIVTENIYRWLRAGGKVFCMVPNVQRVHHDPVDCWRILPDAFQTLFERFCTRVTTYGSLLTSISALSGIASEELTWPELTHVDPQYPVATCVVAVKQQNLLD